MEQLKLPVPPTNAPAESMMAIKIWNMMGGLNWEALPIMIELYGVEDVEGLIEKLVIIRESQNG